MAGHVHSTHGRRRCDVGVMTSQLSTPVCDDCSTSLSSAHKHVNMSVAALIKWADQVLLHGDASLDRSAAENVIKCLSDAVKVRHILGTS